MKKGKEWLAYLSKKEQKEFKKNCELQNRSFESEIELEYENFNLFILASFEWDITPQGGEYWEKISYRKVE